MMNCDQVRELEAAFALDALEEEDARAVREHLATCGQHPDTAELQAAAAGLALAGDEHQPSAGLRERVLASAAAAPGRDTEARHTGRLPGRRWLAAAAVLAIVIATGGIAALVAGGDGGGEPEYVHEFTTEGNLAVRVEGAMGEPELEVSFSGMEPLEEGEEYRLWAIRGENWLSIGAFEPNESGGWSGAFDFALMEGDSLCLTVQDVAEPSGPFGEPVFIEPL